MRPKTELRVRRSLLELQDEYAAGNRKPLEALMRAWKGIKELPPGDPNSFFVLGGYHGEPFRGAGWGNSSYWGGYCNHGNVLFPTWHRVYLVKLEEALRSIPGCDRVTLPFWDETSEESLKNGIPWSLTNENFVLDGETIPNPLRSFALTRGITDNINGDNPDYSKFKGYETVRYPLSGLVGNGEERAQTQAHNALYPNYGDNVALLNRNIVQWLTSATIAIDGRTIQTHVKAKFASCMDAPNYTVFSNTSSAAQWNDGLETGAVPVVPLESPHNDIHLAIGGFDIPGQTDFSPISGANGDMGENDTAALDPIFYFHHCFIDRVFWLWQRKHGFTDHLEIMAQYPGTNSVDSQGPTPGTTPNSWLTLETPLNPFTHRVRGAERPYTSLDCVHIEKQLGYTYGPGSPVESPDPAALTGSPSARVVRVSGINRAQIRGSFLVSAFAKIGGKKYHLGTETVLSRWSVQGCANCQTHLEVKAFISLGGFSEVALVGAEYEIEILGRDGLLTRPAAPATLFPTFEKKLFRLQVR